MPERRDAIAALQSHLVPALRERGFTGSFPNFRRIGPDRTDLLSVQFDKNGGGFVVEISVCGPDGLATYQEEPISAEDALPPDTDHRVRLGQDWFRYDGGRSPEDLAQQAAGLLQTQADPWWTAQGPTRGPRVVLLAEDGSTQELPADKLRFQLRVTRRFRDADAPDLSRWWTRLGRRHGVKGPADREHPAYPKCRDGVMKRTVEDRSAAPETGIYSYKVLEDGDWVLAPQEARALRHCGVDAQAGDVLRVESSP